MLCVCVRERFIEIKIANMLRGQEVCWKDDFVLVLCLLLEQRGRGFKSPFYCSYSGTKRIRNKIKVYHVIFETCDNTHITSFRQMSLVSSTTHKEHDILIPTPRRLFHVAPVARLFK